MKEATKRGGYLSRKNFDTQFVALADAALWHYFFSTKRPK